MLRIQVRGMVRPFSASCLKGAFVQTNPKGVYDHVVEK